MRADQKRKRAAEEPCNVACKALKLQLGPGAALSSRRQRVTDAAPAYRGMQLQRDYDGFDPRQPTPLALQARVLSYLCTSVSLQA